MALILRRVRSSVRLPAGSARFAWFGQQSTSDWSPSGEAWQLHKTNEPVRFSPPQEDGSAPHIFFSPAKVPPRPAKPPNFFRATQLPEAGPGFHRVVSGMSR
uniref:Uncharacterized protein n=1 Tax=Prymnesium polylepis TaxID=72548 RepID=A0A7S4MLE5_9EUKA|mmetsp:Transcript_31526/g.77693  ORF Transcript_31526/g.77693 Transcript_31526/m.77693 type:complete len:102 (+) Transcript_31526:64-369(+)